jgi:SMI1 / KNR4 family (SUKH-1)
MSRVSDLEELPELLRRWDRAALSSVPYWARLPPEAEARGSILRDGATEEEICAAEERLGVRLPPQYRAFLALSNGAHAGEGGPDFLERGAIFRPAGLLPVQEVVRLEAGVPWLWETYSKGRGYEYEQAPFEDGLQVDIWDTTPARDALLISHPEQHATVMLVPAEGEWQVWRAEHTGPEGCASFASWLRAQLRGLRPAEPVDVDAELAKLDADRSAGIMSHLAASGDPRWFELARHRLCDPSRAEELRAAAAATMCVMGESRAVAPLRSALPSIRGPWHRLQLLQALDFCGDPDARSQLEHEVATQAGPKLREQLTRYLDIYDSFARW